MRGREFKHDLERLVILASPRYQNQLGTFHEADTGWKSAFCIAVLQIRTVNINQWCQVGDGAQTRRSKPFLLLSSSKISARVLCLAWCSGMQVNHGAPWEIPEERQRTITNCGQHWYCHYNSRRLRRNLGDMKTTFKNTDVARQQKENICFLPSFGHVTSHGLREVTSGKPWLVTRKTHLMERKAKHGSALP